MTMKTDKYKVSQESKYIIQSINGDNHKLQLFLAINDQHGNLVDDIKYSKFIELIYNRDLAFRFDTKEEAEKWTNPLMEVVEVTEDGNEIEDD